MTSVLALVNEVGENLQFSTRRALFQLTRDAVISGHEVISFLNIARTLGGDGARRHILERTRVLRPDVVVLQHPAGSVIDEELLFAIRSVCSPFIVYYEGDPYAGRSHPLPQQAQAAARVSDVVFTVGDDRFRTNMRAAGARDVRWTPSRFDPWRISNTHGVRDNRIVMIANRSIARLPWRRHPNADERARLATLMEDAPNFDLYGANWKHPSARGPLPFLDQQKVISQSSASLNWDHYAREAMYFSNRLPITMAVGSIHVTTRHPGLSEYLRGIESVVLADSPADAARLVKELSQELDEVEITRRIKLGRDFAMRHLRADDLVVTLLAACGIWQSSPSIEWDLDIPLESFGENA